MRRKRTKFTKLYIGIDNGVSGTIGYTDGYDISKQIKMPVFSQQNYTKAKGNITRIDSIKLKRILELLDTQYSFIFCSIERPMVNPGRFKASISAVRALETTQTTLEQLQIPYQFVDSKQWQKEMLPKGIKGKELKKAGIDIAKRLFPAIECKPDADGILIAEWSRRNRFRKRKICFKLF